MKLFATVLNVLVTLGAVLFIVWVIWNLYATFHGQPLLSALTVAE